MNFALIHSPLVGPSAWQLVATHLESKCYQVVLPTLVDVPLSREPYWCQHANSASEQINAAFSAEIGPYGNYP